MSPGTVYIIQSGAYYKIGRTRHLAKRVAELCTGSPVSLTVVYHLDTPESNGLEGVLHRRFAEVRVQGEWYQLTPKQLAAIMAIRQWPVPRSLTEAEQLPLPLIELEPTPPTPHRGTGGLRRTRLRCCQCRYSWFERQGPVKGGPPRQYPSCHSTRWNKRTPYDPTRPRRRRKQEAPGHE